ncbi:hypothetical protein D7U34_12680 [Salmonella enterica]|nr:hypothetical protein [Salmonella enterica]EBH8948467.1 hypothetical protein [Salmonella enterica subsp. diarizonae serovar 48:i:z]EAU3168585.1 hypothetical protein [Salmonella enterica]EAV0890597.1 hypothetical protein [Salmonella enterica]EBJ3539324.1 hypothetical protein [Salmonella enterica]
MYLNNPLNGINASFNDIKTRKKGQKTAFLWGKNHYFFDELPPPAPKKRRHITTLQHQSSQRQTQARQGLQLYRG